MWLRGKESACNAEATGDAGLISESGRSPGGGHGNPLQYSCPENPMDRGAWPAAVQRIAQSWRGLKRLSTHALHGKEKYIRYSMLNHSGKEYFKKNVYISQNHFALWQKLTHYKSIIL